ncbi:MAG: glycosyltransferase family 4 protein [Gammaproteobacteria bacterium]
MLCVTLYGDRAEAATFIGLHRNGCDVTVYCMPESPYIEAFRSAGMRVIDGGFRARFDRDAIRRLRAELGRVDYDIVHLLHNKPVSNGLRALAAFPKPKVVVYRGIVGNVSVWNPLSWLRYLHPRIDRVICVAEAVRQYFLSLRLLWFRLPSERFVTIHKGHEISWYETAPADLGQFDLPLDSFVVGCVANLRPRKGVHVLVEAFGLLPSNLPIYLLLVGNMDSETLDRAIDTNPNAARIRKAGFQRSAPAIVATCDVAVLPTLRREGLPKTVIEAMVAGVAPIVTNVGGSPELVEHGRSGLVVPPGDAQALADAIMKLYREPALRRRLGEAARQRIATEFRSDVTVARTLALYHELLAERESVPA